MVRVRLYLSIRLNMATVKLNKYTVYVYINDPNLRSYKAWKNDDTDLSTAEIGLFPNEKRKKKEKEKENLVQYFN